MLVVRVGVARGVGALELPPLAELPEPRRSLRPRPRFRERPPPKLELGLGPFGEFAELALRSEKAASLTCCPTNESRYHPYSYFSTIFGGRPHIRQKGGCVERNLDSFVAVVGQLNLADFSLLLSLCIFVHPHD